MPLAQGRSREVIAHNIAELIDSGHNPQQAAAITYREAGGTSDEEVLHAKFYAPTVLGPTQRETPEGYLLCEGVQIARTGELLYVAGEIMATQGQKPLEPGKDGLIRVNRDGSEIFDPVAMASFLGKPVTIDHPDDDVTPDNWKAFSVGVAFNIRPGEGPFPIFSWLTFLFRNKSGLTLSEMASAKSRAAMMPTMRP